MKVIGCFKSYQHCGIAVPFTIATTQHTTLTIQYIIDFEISLKVVWNDCDINLEKGFSPSTKKLCVAFLCWTYIFAITINHQSRATCFICRKLSSKFLFPSRTSSST